jgi:Helix-turn-helix domain
MPRQALGLLSSVNPPLGSSAPLAGTPPTDDEREQISLGINRTHSARRIGRRLGRHHSVITHEPARNRRLG